MTKKKLLVISGIGLIVGGIFLNVDKFGICKNMYVSNGYIGCFNTTQDNIGGIIELIFVPLFIITLLLFFLRDEVFNAWFKFARIGLPVSVLVIMSASANGSFFMSDRSITFGFVSIVFLGVSFLLIIYQIIRAYRKA